MIADIWQGLRAYATAISMLGKHGWWRFALVPGIISLGLGLVIFAATYTLSDNIGRFLVQLYPFEQGKAFAATVATVFGGLMILIAALLVFKNIVMLLVSPWLNQLSLRIEQVLTGNNYTDRRSFNVAFQRTVRLNLRILLREIFYVLLLFCVAWIPIVDFIVPIGIILIQAYYAGFGNLDYFMDRHYSVSESVTFVRRNKGIALGNGLGFLLLLAIPFIGIFLAPTLGVAAATLSGVKRKEDLG